jgi:hypothetical protein
MFMSSRPAQNFAFVLSEEIRWSHGIVAQREEERSARGLQNSGCIFSHRRRLAEWFLYSRDFLSSLDQPSHRHFSTQQQLLR